MKRWAHQERGVNGVLAKLDAGHKAVCLTSPTGGGKSVMMLDIINWALGLGKSVALYTNRRMLTEQLIGVFQRAGTPFGVRAAGFDEYRDANNPVQICSLATENARVFRRRKSHGKGLSDAMQKGTWRLHESDFDIFDEIHMFKGEMLEQVIREKREMGASAVGITATPLGISHLFPELVIAGTNSELRRCGAHVPCYVRAPDEPDCSKIKREATGEFSLGEIRKKIWTQQIYGRVFSHWKLYNPDARPTILFAPGVKESVHFAQDFEKRGVRWAHIDGEEMYLDGKLYKKAKNATADIKGMLEDGTLKGVSNRFVCREGIDIPCLYHCILATPIGSLLSYIQAVGRILRSHPSLSHVLVQDHGGNYWRHGSPNADRDWTECYTLPARVASELRLDRIREKKEPEPIRCPKCSAIRLQGAKCHSCGYEHTKSSRMVLQVDGSLKTVEGDVVKPHRVACKANTEQIWQQCYHRIRRTGGSFKQALGLFMHENYYYPPNNLKFMPISDVDLYRKIGSVPPHRLHGYEDFQTKRFEKSLFQGTE